jgi:hypothetical protein
VADKSTPLVLAALGRAAAAAEPVPLHGTRAAPGLFPATAAGKQAAQRCRDDGLLAVAEPPDPPAAGGTAVKKKAAAPCCTITDKGLGYLLAQVSPRQVLEDFVRGLEARQHRVADCAAALRALQSSTDGLKASVEKILDQFPPPERAAGAGGLKALFREFLAEPAPVNGQTLAPPAALEGAVLAELQRWQQSGASEDCPLPHLYRQSAAGSIGLFHDALRRLHDAGQIYLHPWTGPLYELPEPPFALLVGHEIAYYASLREGMKDEG